ncbi:MAG TPA: calcium-binding protein [Burkholderiales bacterium]|nr:calcium-binding protein [Burkholderiales bacterium]
MAIINGTSSNDHLIGTEDDDTITGNAGADTIEGLGGNDTVRGGNGRDRILGGEGDNELYGDAGQDTLIGGSGRDFLDGGLGEDRMEGGFGDDHYIVNNSGDRVIETNQDDYDIVHASVSFTLAANLEELDLLGSANINGTGNDGHNVIIGNSGNNRLSGKDGDDILSGLAGADTLNGGNDDDLLYSNAEGAATGDNARDVLNGGTGNDELHGDSGGDRLVGGTGNDTYYVAVGNVVVEDKNAGTDTVIAQNQSWTLAANVENLILQATNEGHYEGIGNNLANRLEAQDSAGAHIALFGLGGNDWIVSNAFGGELDGGDGDDTLDGADGWQDIMIGGAGSDWLAGGGGEDYLSGGTGDDTYFGVWYGDNIVEGSNSGNDTVYSADASWTLSANVENLYIDPEVEGPIEGVGNDLDNYIEVYSMDLGTPVTLYGLGGDDELHSHNIGGYLDGGDGNDLLRASNEAHDTLIGGAGNDSLIGTMGGDILEGGAGNDSFVFGGRYSETQITDFEGELDVLQILEGEFEFATVGQLEAMYFHAGTEATTADHRLIYDATAGALYYDADGTGEFEQELMAHINVVSGTFNNEDIEIIAA